jgi:hypothetical protein
MKITKSLLKQIIKEELLINEGFKEKKAQFIKQGADPQQVTLAFDQFKQAKEKGFLEGDDINIDKYKNFGELTSKLNSLEGRQSKTEEKKEKAEIDRQDFDILREDENVIIGIPKSHGAACKYGANTKWCITQSDGHHWDKYEKEDVKIIYIINKAENTKWALAVYAGGEKMEAFDEQDRSIDPKKLISTYNIPDEWLQNSITVDTAWLDKKGIKWKDNGDGSIDILGDLNISGMGLTELPFLPW